MIIDLTDAHWHFEPDMDRGTVKVVVEAEGRRFVARLGEATLPALERLVEELPRTGRVDLAREAARVLGQNPFAEEDPDRRPWYRRLIRPRIDR